MTRKSPKLRTYRVTFHRNDGEWHNLDYNMSPIETFKAKDDADILAQALEHIRKDRSGSKDFWVTKIVEVVVPEVTRRVRLTRQLRLGTLAHPEVIRQVRPAEKYRFGTFAGAGG